MFDISVLLFFIYILIVGTTFCYLNYKKWNEKKERCSLRLRVTVVDVLSKKTKKGDTLLYKPIFKINSTNQFINSAIYTNIINFNIGDSLVLLINPLDINDFMFEEENLNVGKSSIMSYVWLVIIFLVFVLLYCILPL